MVDVEKTIASIVMAHTNEPEEEPRFIAYDVRVALGLPEVVEVNA